MKVKATMTKDVIWARPTDSLRDVYDILRDAEIRHLAVVDEEAHIVGVITQSDLFLYAVVAENEVHIPDIPVQKAMTPDPIVCHEDSSIEHVAQVMIDEKVNCVPVTRGRRLVGMVTSSDVMSLIVARERIATRAGSAIDYRLRSWRDFMGHQAGAVSGAAL